MDIVAIVGTQHVLAIEDKVYTSEHSEQLPRYAERIGINYKDRTPVLIYMTTGGQCSYDVVRNAGWTPVTRKDLLTILRPLKNDVPNAIFLDFLGNIEAMDARFESYRSIAPPLWRTQDQWRGFYDALRQSLREGDWDYVANPSGGFMSYRWAWTPVYGGQLFLQLEEESLVVKVMVSKDDGDARRVFRDRWLARMVGRHRGLRFDRPARLGHGKYMTVAVYHGAYRAIGVDGLLDHDVTARLLKRAARVVRAMGRGTKSLVVAEEVMEKRSSTKAGAREQLGTQLPPDDIASAYQLNEAFEYAGHAFVKTEDGVHGVIAPPNHEPSSDWSWIERLALSFDGYEQAGSFEGCAKVANRMADRFAKNGTLQGSVKNLRLALFFEQRRFRHMGWAPDEDAMVYIRALVAELRLRMGDDWIKEQRSLPIRSPM